MTKTKEEEVAMMADPDLWPRWPVLPVICLTEHFKDDGLIKRQQCGVLFADAEPTVYLINIFETGQWKTWQDRFDGCQKLTYRSFEELASLWRVD